MVSVIPHNVKATTPIKESQTEGIGCCERTHKVIFAPPRILVNQLDHLAEGLQCPQCQGKRIMTFTAEGKTGKERLCSCKQLQRNWFV